MTNIKRLQEQLFARFKDLGIKSETYSHPPLFSVEASRKHRGNIPGAHCKNLFLKDKKGAFWLLVALEDSRIDLKSVPKIINSAHLSFGKPELMLEILGVTPGSVTPFGLINDLKCTLNIVLDERMMQVQILNYHPLSNDATTSISPRDLIRFVESCGHIPHILPISSTQESINP